MSSNLYKSFTLMKKHNCGKFHQYSICGCIIEHRAFMEKGRTQSQYFWSNFESSLTIRLEDGQNRKRNKQQCEKTSAIELSKYVRRKSLFHLPFQRKIRLLFAVFGVTLPGNMLGSQVKVVESKFDKYYFFHTVPGQLPVKEFGSNIFQFCSYISQRTFQKNVKPDFQIWLVFLVPFLHF